MHQSNVRAWDFFLLRTPARRIEECPVEIETALTPADGRPAYLELLRRFAAEPLRREAVRLASPSLSRTLDAATDADGGVDSVSDAQARRAALAALRYDVRMRTRPTPFGVFAGVSRGMFGPVGAVAGQDAPCTRTLPDMDWLYGLVRGLETDPALLPYLDLVAQPTLAVHGSRIFLTATSNSGLRPGEPLRDGVSVRATAPVLTALATAADGVSAAELLEYLAVRFPATSPERILDLVLGLVDKELLITRLRPPLDGGDPLAHLLDALRAIGERTPTVAPLVAAVGGLAERRAAYDGARPGARETELVELVAAARALRPHDTPLHVDLALPWAVTLPDDVRREAETAVHVLWRLAPDRLGMRPLRAYHEAFLEHYGAGRLVPLLELVDETAGLGYPAGYEWPRSETRARLDESPDRERDKLLAALSADAVRDRTELVLDEQMLDGLTRGTPDPRDVQTSGELYVRLAAASMSELSAGRFLLVVSPNPGSHQTGATLGRFGDLLFGADDALGLAAGAVVPMVPGAVQVNIVYQPRSPRAANIAHVPAHSGRRISVGVPPAGGGAEYLLRDLAVGATLERMFVVHTPSGAEIEPVSHTMLSPGTQAPNIARLLWELGQEGRRLWEPWDWGSLSAVPFLPRVRHGRTVLFPATWKLDALRAQAASDPADWAGTVARWRKHEGVPRTVSVLSTDQRLLVDLDDPWHLELLRDELRRDPVLVAQEHPGEDRWLDDPASGPDDVGPARDQGAPRRVTELAIPFVRREGLPAPRPSVIRRVLGTPGRRVHSPGGEWLYLKLYCPARGHDQFLREHLSTLVHTAQSRADVDRWFFIRYADPDPHIRLRFHGQPGGLWGSLLPELAAVLAELRDRRVISRFVVDEYDPEWERYGGPAVQAEAERAFQADSESAIGLLGLLRQPGWPHDLDTLTAISLAALAQAFGLPPGAGGSEADGDPPDAAAAWLAETGTSREVPKRFREQRESWRRLIDPAAGWPGLRGDAAGDAVLTQLLWRDQKVADLADRLRAVDSDTPPLRVVGSLLHMSCNRLFGGNQDRERDALGLARGSVLANLSRRRHSA